MKTLTRNEAIDELTDREYDYLVNAFKDESKRMMLPLIKSGLGGFEKETNEELISDFWKLYDEQIEITE